MLLDNAKLLIPIFASAALAQTYSSCNPTEKSTCSSNTGLSTSTYSIDFTKGSSTDWNVTAGSVSYSSTNGAEFTINKSGDAPTIETSFYIFFGSISVIMRTSNGTGIVSSAILESDDLDEVDWEWLGGSSNQVQTNYFGKGNTTSYDRAKTYSVSDSQTTSHNYTIVWTSSSTIWYIDGTAVRTLNYNDALSGKNYPQTPMRVKLGIWAGGDSSNDEGTIEWAGGATNYNQAPFTMYVEKVEITNFNPATSYTYGDMTGDWTSIKLENGTKKSESVSSKASGATATTKASSSSTATDSMWWTASASAVRAATKSAGAKSLVVEGSKAWMVFLAGVWGGVYLL